jgi:DNA polymerase III delta prime subunit
MSFDAPSLAGGMPDPEAFPINGPMPIDLPLALDFRSLGALRIEHDAANRTHALAMLRSILLRTVTTIPAGRLRLVLCDPVGLGQEFAGFMHLADHEEADVLDRIWTEPAHIEQRLTDLTEHMENVIQTYLRNEYDSIEEYNAQAGEIAEPYRLLVLADFPEGLSDRAAQRLESIIASGRRCGVFTMICRDTKRPLPEGLSETALNEGSLRMGCTDGTWSLIVPELPSMPMVLEPPPDDLKLTTIVERIGAAAAGSRRVEVSFDIVAPTLEERWSRSTENELRVPIGQSGATRRLELRLGRGTMQHALLAGKTGSGKSTLLHVLITNLALWCSPDEVEFYLVDFKKGVEFQAYANRSLPHARVIAIESDREFGLSVLRRLDTELRTRGERFRDLGVQDISGFRKACSDPMPRVLLIIDEFQEFFIDDDPIAQEASLLLDRLVRQGRAFGMHAILGSQTLDGAYSLARSTLGQMGVRIALQCSEGDSYLILSDENPAARLLGRPGEAIYNDAGGRIEGNTPFQIVWLDDADRDAMLADISALDGHAKREQFVFRGHIPAALPQDRLVKACLAGDHPALPEGGLLPIRLGEPVAIRESTDVVLRPQAGGNALLVGQHPEAATAVLCGAVLQAALRLKPAATPNDEGLQIWLIDGQPPDAMLAGRLATFTASLPHVTHRVTVRNVESSMQDLAAILAERADGRREGRATILIVGIDMHRLRDLRVREDDYGFSSDDTDAGARPDKILGDLLREGPSVGMHAMLWFDGTANLGRTLDRNSQREFEQKILFQMSANDSGQLIDSTAASDLGLHRGLLYVEDTGTLEKFRPWALPDPAWLAQVAESMSTPRTRD